MLVLPNYIQYCIDTLERGGFAAFAVGGCVRDSLLARAPNDWDLCTDALPSQIAACFSSEKTIPTGIKHGTLTVILEQGKVEITTFRSDGVYLDHRHPVGVTFTRSLEQDLSRRDFTVNAMAYHPAHGIVDPFGGERDLAARRLRCVGAALERFNEDALRILRLFRFCAQLEFAVDPDALAAARLCGGNLARISGERINVELDKILISRRPEPVLAQMLDTGVLQAVIPEFAPCVDFVQNNAYHNRTVDKHIIAAVGASPPERDVRLALLLHDIGKPRCFREDDKGVSHFGGHQHVSAGMARQILTRLRYDNDTSRRVVLLIERHDQDIPTDAAGLRRLLSRIGEQTLRQLIAVRIADTHAKDPAATATRLERLICAYSALEDLMRQGPVFRRGDLAVNGGDLLALGYQKGKALGNALDTLMELVLDDPDKNTKEILLARAKEWL